MEYGLEQCSQCCLDGNPLGLESLAKPRSGLGIRNLAFLSRISHFYLASRIFNSHLAFFYLASRIFFISHLAFLCRIYLQKFFSSPIKLHLECPLQASVPFLTKMLEKKNMICSVLAIPTNWAGCYAAVCYYPASLTRVSRGDSTNRLVSPSGLTTL